MFNRPTVIVIGAGASFELGLPLGRTLCEQIEKKLQVRYPDGRAAGERTLLAAFSGLNQQRRPLGKTDLEVLSEELREALYLTSSIDTLLDKHADDDGYVLCGKLGITSAILEAEAASALATSQHVRLDFSTQGIRDSYLPGLADHLFRHVPNGKIEEAFKNVYFVVFNYDRCLEVFLKRAIEVLYRVPSNEAAKIINEQAQIFHPYGKVGLLPWQTNTSEHVIFGEKIQRWEKLHKTAQGIRTFTERVEDEQARKQLDIAKSKVAEARVMVFLGLSSGRDNLRLLSPPDQGRQKKRYFGTAVAISTADVKVIEGDLVSYCSPSLAASGTTNLVAISAAALLSHFSRSISD